MTTSPMIRRRKLMVLLAVFVVVAAACAGSETGGEPAAADPATAPGANAASDAANAADFEFALFDGSLTSIASFSGKPAVVNFWASWCPSCVAEMSAAFRPVAEELDDQVAFIGLNIQDERDRALELLDVTGVEWVNGEDPEGQLFVELGGLGMPFTVFIDAAGAIVDTHNGPLNEDQLRTAVAELLTS